MDIFGNISNLPGDPGKRKVKAVADFEYNLSSETETERVVEDIETKKEGFKFAKILALLLFSGLFVKLFLSQIVYGRLAEDLALGNKIRPRVISASRGVITDTSGNWLVKNVPTFDLAVFPSDLPKNKDERNGLYQKLAAISGISAAEIKDKSEANGLLLLDSVTIKENISREDSLLYEEKISGLAGMEIVTRSSRQYSLLPGISQILGYTGKLSDRDKTQFSDRRLSDWVGKTGLELSYENNLHGTDGVEQIEVDSKGNVDRVLIDKNNRQPVAGNNLSLYLDSGLQQKSAEALSQGIENAKQLSGDQSVSSGVVIAMDPNTGGILSMVSVPSYDDNLFSKGISAQDYQNLIDDPNKPMFNRALLGQYPPGSTIKPVMATAGLSEGVITPNTSIVSPAAITIGSYVFPDWKDHSYESTDVRRAIAESNNIFFYSVGGGFDKIKGLGIENMKRWWQRFGYGEKTGIDLPNEASGLLPDPAWKKKTQNADWYIGDTYHAAIGQGDLLVTPIQMVRMVSAIANGGKLLNPQIVQKETDSNGNVVRAFGPRIENAEVAPLENIQVVQQGMRQTITVGSARSIFPDVPYTLAGKTGTAQFSNNQKTHAWFECYAPYDHPTIALLVMVEGGGEGFDVSGPIAKNILDYYFSR